MRKAIALGFSVAKPWGESDRYDVIINDRDIFWRVQVKSVWGGSRYCVKTTGHRRVPYTADEIDFLVAYVNPKNVWYVLPISQIASRKHLYLRPFRWKSKYEQYRDAWHLFREVDSQ